MFLCPFNTIKKRIKQTVQKTKQKSTCFLIFSKEKKRYANIFPILEKSREKMKLQKKFKLKIKFVWSI